MRTVQRHTTFLDELSAGTATRDDVAQWEQRWHAGEAGDDMSLNEWLGLTWPEYWHWVTAGVLPDPQARRARHGYVRLQGGAVMWAHGPTRCTPPCAVHWPSRHRMRHWPQRWRADRDIMERVCEHGAGHPDPDDREVRAGNGAHPCCLTLCCAPDPPRRGHG